MSGIAEAEAEWLAETIPEMVEFEFFQHRRAMALRRHLRISAALADIGFDYEPGAVWLNMIVSERAGQGYLLIERIKELSRIHRFQIVGQAVPTRPTNWVADREWRDDESILLNWYTRQGFRVVDGDRLYVAYP